MPRARLHARAINLTTRNWDDPRVWESEYERIDKSNPNLIKLQENANPSHLKASRMYATLEGCLEQIQALKQVLLSTPALCSLSINTSETPEDCTSSPVPAGIYCGMGFTAGKGPPPLEEFEVVAYRGVAILWKAIHVRAMRWTTGQ